MIDPPFNKCDYVLVYQGDLSYVGIVDNTEERYQTSTVYCPTHQDGVIRVKWENMLLLQRKFTINPKAYEAKNG